MGLVVDLSGAAIDRMLYGDRSNFLSNYLQSQLAQIGPSFNAMSQRLTDTLLASYNYVNDKLTQYGIRNELSSKGLAYVDNYYTEALDWTSLQNLNLTMQRWAMCHPELRKLYLDQNVDGYSNSYVNITGNDIGEEDYNYRRVMNGVITDTGYTIYHEDLLPGDRELDHYEKDIILNTHSAISWMLENCQFDFTNKSEQPTKLNRS